jgi:DNA-binding NarL/FixJ family response regulator
VLGLLCERLTNPEIADRLYIGTRTVEFHVANILGKLGAEDRRQAAAIAARHGLV